MPPGATPKALAFSSIAGEIATAILFLTNRETAGGM
jgi:hypothetical protein